MTLREILEQMYPHVEKADGWNFPSANDRDVLSPPVSLSATITVEKVTIR